MFDHLLLQFFYSAPLSVSFFAGVLTFVSPCILPLIPAYMSYISGVSLEDIKSGSANRWRVIFKSILFILGFGLTFILLGVPLAKLIHQAGDWLNYISGAVIIIFGLHFLGIFRIGFLYKTKKVNFEIKSTQNKFLGFLAPIVLGISFALGWTPCVGPILSSILFLGGTQEGYALGLMSAYTLGLAIPFLLVAILLNRALGILNKIKKYARTIEIISGVLLIFIGIIILSGSMRDISEILMQKLGGI
ncbi:cytochrome c biogenesis protein CcdA [Helicobacter cappadocius]|uniref:Cytochrome c biogenesis protein CcdA n=1 Tax=Helicobacter cappadocius TaxID=3063998 RepID=A0AA90SSP7_9HELI|nr:MULTISPECIES: cytochrome c biogenesis protein CcdA [unclassified Helicobacter]MDO7253240.1 cytochrome c biogenesis protein CcdA [Helicobacter sp. faydin-H75]MDP2539164.1 cytochrome c biogenesis protein CcdA [Helicobacter sp. faydin-H76]